MIQPKIFGKFILLERVGMGGMAEVFRAKLLNTPDSERFFAIKRILPHLAKNSDFVKIFIDEAKVAVDLDHPNVCRIFELGRLGELHYIAMEYIAGRDVEAIQNYYRKQKKIMSVSQACFIIAQGAQGLDYAHRLLLSVNFVHRDVSPQNLLVTYDGVVKLIDFGVAKAQSSRKSAKSDSGVAKGKFSYMSPEQAMGGDIDRRSDIFALGVVFWELLTGRRLFPGENEFAIMDAVTECKIERPSKYNRMIPERVEQICMKALEKDVNKRYQWASELVDDLYEFISGCKIPFTQWHLQNWMCTAFKEAFDAEWAKIPVFNTLNSEADVEKYNKEHAADQDPLADAKTMDVEALSALEADGKKSAAKLPPIPGRVKPTAPGDKKSEDKPEEKLEKSSPAINENDDDIELEPEGVGPDVSDPTLVRLKRVERNAKIRKFLMGLIIAICVGCIACPFLILANVIELPQPEIHLPESATLDITLVPENEARVMVYRAPREESSQPVHEAEGSHIHLEGLEAGGYEIRVEMDGYATEDFSVSVENGISEARFEMSRAIPVDFIYDVYVKPEDANLYVDGERIEGNGGKFTLGGVEGENYRFEVRRSGYEPVVKTGIFDDEEDRFDIVLDKPIDVSLRIGSEPRKSVVYFLIDGKAVKQGETPFSLDKVDNTAPLQIEVRHLGYETWTRTVDFQDADTPAVQIFADLQASN